MAGTCGVDGKRRVLVLSVSGCCHVWVPSGALPTGSLGGGGGDVLDLDRCAPHFRFPPFSAYLTFLECEEEVGGFVYFLCCYRTVSLGWARVSSAIRYETCEDHRSSTRVFGFPPCRASRSSDHGHKNR